MRTRNVKEIARIFKEMLDGANVSYIDAGKSIRRTLSSFRNKMSLNRFSIEEMLTLSELCGYYIELKPKKMNDFSKRKTYAIDPQEFLPEDILINVENIKVEAATSQIDLLLDMLPKGMDIDAMINYLKGKVNQEAKV